MHDDPDDKIAERIVHTFLRASEVARARRPHGRNVTMEMDAHDLLMDWALLLEPVGLAEVMLILEEEQSPKPTTRVQVAAAINFVIESEDAAKPARLS